MRSNRDSFENISRKLDKIALEMEKSKLADYVYYIENPRKMFLSNFISGIARGFGIAIGFTLLGAVVVYILQIIVRLKLPLIGEFISDIVKIVQNNMQISGGNIGG